MTFFGDSKLVVEQMNQRWAIRNEGLKELNGVGRKLLPLFAAWSIVYLPRERNKAADALSKKAAEKYAYLDIPLWKARDEKEGPSDFGKTRSEIADLEEQDEERSDK